MSDRAVTELHGSTFVAWKREIEQQTDRGVGIIAPSFLEARLEEAIRSRLVVKGGGVDELLGKNGAIGTFSAKIDLAFALELFGQQVYRELTLIRKIRNEFAHEYGAIGFQTPAIKSRCAELWIPQNILNYGEAAPPTDPREQFMRAVLTIFHLLLTEMDENRPDLRQPKKMPW
jgi:mannitol operon repressor